jgi:hypothetical protein
MNQGGGRNPAATRLRHCCITPFHAEAEPSILANERQLTHE